MPTSPRNARGRVRHRNKLSIVSLLGGSLFLGLLNLGLLLGLVVEFFFPFLARFTIVVLQSRFIRCWMSPALCFERLARIIFAERRPVTKLAMSGGWSGNFYIFSTAFRTDRRYARQIVKPTLAA